MVIAIDFDGVIHDHKHPVPGRRMGPPMEGTAKKLKEFKLRAIKIIVFTIWGDDKGRKTIADFLNYYEIPFDEITNIKPQADYYIDDKAIHFESWDKIVI